MLQEPLLKAPLPPQKLMIGGGNPASGVLAGKDYVSKLAAAGIDTKSGVLLDIGCGWGRMAYALQEAGFEGEYIGFDIRKHRMDWLTKNFSTVHPNYAFHFFDVRNDRYAAAGANESLPLAPILEGRHPTGVFALSVFTHLYEAQIDHYLSEVRATIDPNGRAVFTAFVLGSEERENIRLAKPTYTMAHRLNEHTWYERESDPLFAIAYSPEFFDTRMRKHGFDYTIIRGQWSSGAKKDRHQDWIVARPI